MDNKIIPQSIRNYWFIGVMFFINILVLLSVFAYSIWYNHRTEQMLEKPQTQKFIVDYGKGYQMTCTVGKDWKTYNCEVTK